MNFTEKVLLSLATFSFALQLLPNFPGKYFLFILLILILSIFYLVKGKQVLNPKNEISNIIAILSGVAFGTSLISLPFRTHLSNPIIFKLLPIFNIVLLVSLGIYLLIKRKSKNIVNAYKGIIIRSGIIFIILSFFTYLPYSFKPYRYVLKALNRDSPLINNLQMIDYSDVCEKALDENDWWTAIKYAEKSNKEGIIWLKQFTSDLNYTYTTKEEDVNYDIDSVYFKLEKSLKNYKGDVELDRIGKTYSNLFLAYNCLGDALYDEDEYDEAITAYQIAKLRLNTSDHSSNYWMIKKAYLLNDLALCYRDKGEYDIADSLFVKSIEKYSSLNEQKNSNLAILYQNYAKSLSKNNEYYSSNIIYKKSIELFELDSVVSIEDEKDITRNYHSIIKNNLSTDSLEQAKIYIDIAVKQSNKDGLLYCNSKYYEGAYEYKISNYVNAKTIFTELLDCYKGIDSPFNIAEVHYLLTKTNIMLADYSKAKEHLDKGLAIISTKYSSESVKYANYLHLSAQLNNILGDYYKSEEIYLKVIDTYRQELGDESLSLSGVLSEYANVEIKLSNNDSAKENSDEAIQIARENALISPSVCPLINSVAYVNYSIGLYVKSDSLYSEVISLINQSDKDKSVSDASAHNGLGLVKMAEKDYKKADSLFNQSIIKYKEVFDNSHPSIGTVYLNHAALKIKEGEYSEASDLLLLSLKINKEFFDSNHDIFADIYDTNGDLESKQNNKLKAKEYYEKALDIYSNVFGDDNNKTVIVKNKLSKI